MTALWLWLTSVVCFVAAYFVGYWHGKTDERSLHRDLTRRLLQGLRSIQTHCLFNHVDDKRLREIILTKVRRHIERLSAIQ